MRVLALASLLAALPAAAVEGPVAVMPFKNLNADPQLEWMRVGVAETMVSDLKKRSTLRVVERDQVDKALSEVLLQGQKGAEESTAARVGKLVGAKTIVLGAFQKAGAQLRITARFITAETGEVVDTAKTTGPLSDVFFLQDEIVARLVGEKYARPTGTQATARRASPKRLKAYQLYAMALTTSSDADRVGYLNQSLEQDPQFSYALEELEHLKQRMAGYRQTAEQAGDAEAARLRKGMDDASRPADQRATDANLLMVHYLTHQQHSQVKALCREVLARPEYASLHEQMQFRLFDAERQLSETDAAFRDGEEFLRRFPRSPFFGAVDGLVREMIRNREDRPRHESQYQAKLEQIEKDRAQELSDKGLSPDRVRQSHRRHDYERCSEALSLELPERAITECEAFVKKWASDHDATFAVQLPAALMMEARAYSMLGKNGTARQLGQRLLKEYPEQGREWRVEEIIARAWAGE
ncbi:MAG TPA: CsgG/HfaB family protein [Myxococcales bacterium]|nr:CsgG/HfaB family protein [Myxococcales bacterium]